MELYNDKFLGIDSFARAAALVAITAFTFALTFAVVPFFEWRLHFFQIGIFLAAFLFGPLAGASVGAVASSYNGLFVISNPWIIGGNAILGLAAAYLYTRTTPFKAAMGAFAIQLPYLVITDYYFIHMPVTILLGLIATLLVTNIISALIAIRFAPQIKALLSRQ